MRMRYIILTIVAIYLSFTASSQNLNVQSIGKNDKVIIKKTTVVQDSLLLFYPLLLSIEEAENNATLTTPKIQRKISENLVSLYPVPEKGVIYIELSQLPKSLNPQLEFYNSNGTVMDSVVVRSKVSTINMERVPSGEYMLAIDFGKSKYNCEIVKE